MSAILDARIENTVDSLLKTIELAAKYGDDDTKDLQIYTTMMEDICIAKNNAKRCEKALNIAETKQTVDDFQEAYDSEMNKSNKFISKKTKEFQKFQSTAASILCSQTDQEIPSSGRVVCDDFVMESEISDIDPLTKRRMVHPVKNKICGHYYEKSSILEALRVNPRLRCPVTACGNYQFIQKDDHLVEDNAFKMRLQNLASVNDNENDDDE